MELDQYGNIYVSSRGDYYDTYSETFVIDSNTDKVVDELPLLPNTEMAICRDSLYVVQNGVITPTVGQSLTPSIIQKQRKLIPAILLQMVRKNLSRYLME